MYLTALAFGDWVGHGTYEHHTPRGEDGAPCCLFGHAYAACGDLFYDTSVTEHLSQVGIGVSENDRAVKKYGKGRGAKRHMRFLDLMDKLNVVPDDALNAA